MIVVEQTQEHLSTTLNTRLSVHNPHWDNTHCHSEHTERKNTTENTNFSSLQFQQFQWVIFSSKKRVTFFHLIYLHF